MDDPSIPELERTPAEDASPHGDVDDDRNLPEILDEVKIEEISIDGMCGVY